MGTRLILIPMLRGIVAAMAGHFRQLLVGSFGPDVWQAMHEATPGSKVSNEVCANCQITTTTLKMQSTKIRISSAVLPFSSERTSSV